MRGRPQQFLLRLEIGGTDPVEILGRDHAALEQGVGALVVGLGIGEFVVERFNQRLGRRELGLLGRIAALGAPVDHGILRRHPVALGGEAGQLGVQLRQLEFRIPRVDPRQHVVLGDFPARRRRNIDPPAGH